jgi:hypothetical protein
MNKFKKLHIDLTNICELNQFIYYHSRTENLIGIEYSTPMFYRSEEADMQLDPWAYKINKHGYRGNNWAFNKDAIAFFGCSVTFGIGVEKDIATLSQEILNTECYNIGQPGASALNILKTFVSFINFYPIKTAIITLPPANRIYYPTFIKDSRNSSWSYANLIPGWEAQYQKKIYSSAFTFFNSDTILAYIYDYVKMAEFAANISNTDIIWSSWDNSTLEFLNSVVDNKRTINTGRFDIDKARDRMHPGPLFVNDWSLHIIHEIKKSSSKNT